MATAVSDPGIVVSLSAALANSRGFMEQTAERVNAMKLDVLSTYEYQDVSGDHSNNDEYDRNVTTRIITCVEDRSTALEQFRSWQQDAEKILSGLQEKLNQKQMAKSDEADQNFKEVLKTEREKILMHVSKVQQFRSEQLESEDMLKKFLQLKKKAAQSEDRDALRISQEIKMMESKLDGGDGMSESLEDQGRPQSQVTTIDGNDKKYQTVNPELQRFVFNDVPNPNTACVVLGDVISPQGVSFSAGDQVQFLRAGTKGWSLVLDKNNVPSWLPAFEVQPLHTSQGLLDYRNGRPEIAPTPGGPTGMAPPSRHVEPMQTRTTLLPADSTLSRSTTASGNNAHRAVDGAAAPLGASPPALHDLSATSAPAAASRQRPESHPPARAPGSRGSEGPVPLGHTGVVGLALSTGSNDDFVVAAVKVGGPASRSHNIQVGHRVSKIDGEEVAPDSHDLAQVVRMLCGPAGSFVSVGVSKADGSEVEVVLMREEPEWVREQSHAAHTPATSPPSSVLLGSQLYKGPPIPPPGSYRQGTSPLFPLSSLSAASDLAQATLNGPPLSERAPRGVLPSPPGALSPPDVLPSPPFTPPGQPRPLKPARRQSAPLVVPDVPAGLMHDVPAPLGPPAPPKSWGSPPRHDALGVGPPLHMGAPYSVLGPPRGSPPRLRATVVDVPLGAPPPTPPRASMAPVTDPIDPPVSSPLMPPDVLEGAGSPRSWQQWPGMQSSYNGPPSFTANPAAAPSGMPPLLPHNPGAPAAPPPLPPNPGATSMPLPLPGPPAMLPPPSVVPSLPPSSGGQSSPPLGSPPGTGPWMTQMAAPNVTPLLVDPPFQQPGSSAPQVPVFPPQQNAQGAPAVPAFPSVLGASALPSMPPMLAITPDVASTVPSIPGWGFPDGHGGGGGGGGGGGWPAQGPPSNGSAPPAPLQAKGRGKFV